MSLARRRYQGHVSAALVLGGVDFKGPHLFTASLRPFLLLFWWRRTRVFIKKTGVSMTSCMMSRDPPVFHRAQLSHPRS